MKPVIYRGQEYYVLHDYGSYCFISKNTEGKRLVMVAPEELYSTLEEYKQNRIVAKPE